MADEVEKEVTEETEDVEGQQRTRTSRTGDGAPEEEAGRASRTTISDSDEDVEGQSYLRTRTT